MAAMKRAEVARYQERARAILRGAGIPLGDDAHIEIADFGLGEFQRLGLALVVRINEPEYCSKWLVLLPGQKCPLHFHKLKKETFFIHAGSVRLRVGDRELELGPGQSLTLPPYMAHEFWSAAEAVIEEVSTHDENSDSYFPDPRIVRDTAIED